ncbi:MAG TPA: serine/threonine-protein kinase, partial [Gemmatimonadales bacterium]|nr:serine/threonine-protein kinase [Gemmatimonadales bacterium]
MPSASDQLPPESGHSHEAGLPPGLWEDLRRAFEPRYELRGLLGRGGMGVVIEAWDPVLERPLAIKILSPGDLSQDPTARERLLREARAAATLSHPNVVSVFGVGETPELRAPYILMQRVLGETLERKEQDGGTIGVAEAVRLLGEIAEALTAAHARGMVHRDLKPSNVMVEGSTGRAVVLDFGISHFTPTPGREQVKLTGTGMQVGTPLYMSPEQAAGEPATDKSDIYSLGCLMYEVLSGRPVFEGPTAMVVMASHIKDTPAPIRTLRPEVPEALERVVASMLAKDPASRPSADDLRRRFAPAPDHHPWWEGSAELMRRRARAVLLTGSALAVLALIQYAILTGAFPAAPPLVRSGLIGAFSVTLLLYVGASVAAFLALRRDPIPPAVVQLIAGDWAGEGGLVVDRLRQYAGVGPAEQGALLRAIRWRGLVALSAGSATLGVLALIVLLPGASAVPASIRWSLLLLPSIAVLACTVRLERLREPYDPGLRLRFGPAPRLAGWGRFQQWLAEHASAFTTLGSGTGSSLRSLLATLNLGLAAVGVVILVGLQVFAVQVRDAMGVPAFDRLGAEREEFLPLYAMAGPPASFLPEDSARVVWDRFLVAPWYLPRDSAEALMSRVGMGRTLRDLDRLGLRPRRREESGAVLIAAGFRGFTAERRRVLTELVAAQGTDELRSASRSRA